MSMYLWAGVTAVLLFNLVHVCVVLEIKTGRLILGMLYSTVQYLAVLLSYVKPEMKIKLDPNP